MKIVTTILWTVFAICIVAIIVLSRQAHAQALCGPLDAVKASFQQRYGETVIITAHVAADVDILVLRSPKTGSWTIFRTIGRQACAIAAGKTSEVDHGI